MPEARRDGGIGALHLKGERSLRIYELHPRSSAKALKVRLLSSRQGVQKCFEGAWFDFSELRVGQPFGETRDVVGKRGFVAIADRILRVDCTERERLPGEFGAQPDPVDSDGHEYEHERHYPDDLADDALAVFRALQHRPDINPLEIGFWGSSEGGMLTTQVAARSHDIAFAINSSGSMMPLWRQALYRIGAELRAEGLSAVEVAEAVAFKQLQIRVMRTGRGWPEFRRMRARVHGKKWFAQFFGDDASVGALRWRWDHVYRFDAMPALKLVTCPLLGVFGERDTSTPAAVTVENMRRARSDGRNRDITLRIFPGANHSLAAAQTGADDEAPRLAGMAPGVFDTLASWILARVHPSN